MAWKITEVPDGSEVHDGEVLLNDDEMNTLTATFGWFSEPLGGRSREDILRRKDRMVFDPKTRAKDRSVWLKLVAIWNKTIENQKHQVP